MNIFANHGRFGQHHGHRQGVGRGHRHREDQDSIAHVKLSIPEFTGKEDMYTYLSCGK